MAARPRAVLIYRMSQYDALLARHATHGQIVFFLQQRGLSVEPLYDAHLKQVECIRDVNNQVPSHWRYACVERNQLDRFDFLPDDLILIVGQDGLVPNVSKYLSGQLVVGFDPTRPSDQPSRQRLVVYLASSAKLIFDYAEYCSPRYRPHTMIEAILDDQQTLLALNEIYIGHGSHQSAKYAIKHASACEQQSSSGVIVASGTGATGWMSSLNHLASNPLDLPKPEEKRIVFRVREPWISAQTNASLTAGTLLDHEQLEIVSAMESRGVIFGDGIEQDYLPFEWGQSVTLRIAEQTLNLLYPAGSGKMNIR